jgi:hypothetical protein
MRLNFTALQLSSQRSEMGTMRRYETPSTQVRYASTPFPASSFRPRAGYFVTARKRRKRLVISSRAA